MSDARIRITRVVNEDELGKQIEERMRRVAGAIGARAQRLVPKKTYALHDTITAETERKGSRVTVTVGAGDVTANPPVDYALHVEQGTSRASAQPYLRPAMLQVTGSDFRYSGPGPETRGVRKERAATARARRRERGA